MIFEIYIKHENDYELIESYEDHDQAVVRLAFLRAEGGEYKLEMNNGSMSTILEA